MHPALKVDCIIGDKMIISTRTIAEQPWSGLIFLTLIEIYHDLKWLVISVLLDRFLL